MTDTLATSPAASLSLDAMNPDDLVRQVQFIQKVMKTVMHKDEHYGIIPGTGRKVKNEQTGQWEEKGKPSLLKPGAEKLGFVFRLAPRFEITLRDLGDEHREYEVTCTLEQIHTGRFFGSGVGSCSTMEGKYRYRSEVLEGPDGKPILVPGTYWNSRDTDILGGSQFSAKKQDGQWVIAHKVEHPNPADHYNTCLKMAKKRSHVDAILTATAASDIFTQDVEDMADNESANPPEKNVTPSKIPPATHSDPETTTYQGIIEKTYTSKAAGTDNDKRDLYNAMCNGRELWTRKPDVGQELMDSLGGEIIMMLIQSKKHPNKYQVMSIRIPDRPSGHPKPNMTEEPPPDNIDMGDPH